MFNNNIIVQCLTEKKNNKTGCESVIHRTQCLQLLKKTKKSSTFQYKFSFPILKNGSSNTS